MLASFIAWLAVDPATMFVKLALVAGGVLAVFDAADRAIEARRSRPKERR